jgi:hypothetical protein
MPLNLDVTKYLLKGFNGKAWSLGLPLFWLAWKCLFPLQWTQVEVGLIPDYVTRAPSRREWTSCLETTEGSFPCGPQVSVWPSGQLDSSLECSRGGGLHLLMPPVEASYTNYSLKQ